MYIYSFFSSFRVAGAVLFQHLQELLEAVALPGQHLLKLHQGQAPASLPQEAQGLRELQDTLLLSVQSVEGHLKS